MGKEGNKRPVNPSMMSTKQPAKVRLSPKRCANGGVKGEIKAKASKGKVVSKPKAELPNCQSAPMFCITGPMLVMGRRKLLATNNTPNNSHGTEFDFMMESLVRVQADSVIHRD